MRRSLALLAAALAVTGCGIEDPTADQAAQPPEPASEGAPAGSDLAEEGARPAIDPEPVAGGGEGGAPSPERAASLYARAFSNWTWRDVEETYRAVLPRLAAGDLRRSVRTNAAALEDDATLRRDRLANRGEELALDARGDDPSRRVAWIVLRETSSSGGVSTATDTRVTVYRAVVQRLDDGRWYVTAFDAGA
jgi:hypothetical protein